MAKNSKVKTSKKAVSDEDRERIITKCIEGCSIKTISVVLSLNYHTVHSIVSKFLKYGNADRKKIGGNRKPIFTQELKEALLRKVDADCTTTLKQLKELPKMEHSIKVSINTRGKATTENELSCLIVNKFDEITGNHCYSFYRKILGYLLKCSNKKIIKE